MKHTRVIRDLRSELFGDPVNAPLRYNPRARRACSEDGVELNYRVKLPAVFWYEGVRHVGFIEPVSQSKSRYPESLFHLSVDVNNIKRHTKMEVIAATMTEFGVEKSSSFAIVANKSDLVSVI